MSATTDLNLRKQLGRAHLNANHPEAALSVFASVARDYPGDPEAAVSLGDFYLAAGNPRVARILYERASGLNPRAAGLAARLRLVLAEFPRLASEPSIETQWLAATEPAALKRVLEQLDGQQRTQRNAVQRASAILRAVAASPRPAQAVQEFLPELDALLPALLQLNVENAHAEGRPDLAAAIDDLRRAIENLPAPVDEPAPAAHAAPRARLLFWQPDQAEDGSTWPLLPAALTVLGCQVTSANSLPANFADSFDVLVVRHPHATPGALKAMAAFSALGKRVVVELDYDCEALPECHRDRAALGTTNTERSASYTAALRLADLVAVPSEALAASLRARGYPAACVLPCWSTPASPAPAAEHEGLHIGLIASATDDIGLVRRALTILLHEFRDVRLIVAGDAAAYRLFAELPAGQTLFLPGSSPVDEARALALCDIVLVPLRDTPFNQTLSDARLVRAGRAGVPWVASPVPAVSGWQAGGLRANTPDEWYARLRSLIVDPDQRQALAEAGRRQADTREISRWAPSWLSTLLNSAPAGEPA